MLENMKRTILYTGILSALFFSATSCHYLDVEILDDQKTIEEVFETEETALGALAEVYSYIPGETNWADGSPWTGISDELRVSFTGQNGNVHEINIGAMKADGPLFNTWGRYYQGIRNATYFILHVDDIENWRPNSESIESRRERYRYEARALRAFYYFCLFKQYGPLVILPTESLIASDAPLEEMELPRSTVSKTVQFIVGELDACINSGKLPLSRMEQQNYDYGRMNVTTCMAIKSRLLLYAASDFYNRDRTLELYKNFKDKDGNYLFDYTDEGRIERWQKAADAAKDVIDTHRFQLYRAESTGNVAVDAYNSYREAVQVDWNVENIFAVKDGGWNYHERCVTPQCVNTGCYGGFGPTQQMVDAYFMNDGRLPIIGYEPADSEGNVKAIPNPASNYSEEGFCENGNEDMGYGAGTFNMYVNREPRFYASIAYDNARWISNNWSNTVRFYFDGNAGLKTDGTRRNVSLTGYLAIKLLSEKYNGQTAPANSAARNYVYFRYAEILLNYVEALNEIDFNANQSEIFTYINDIRSRAGIPGYGSGADQIQVSGQDEMRDLIRAERRVELAFEGHRYFDCKRWLLSEETDGGSFYGMNVYQGADNGFYNRVEFEIRSFLPKNYLWPIDVNETYKNQNLVQNPGW